MSERIKIISLTANTKLAENIAKRLGGKVLASNVHHFADGETLFEGLESFRGDNVYIVQSTCKPVNDTLMEVLVCIDACKRASAKSITCIMPYYGYARQDRKAKARQPITAKLVADLLTVAGANRLVCFDLHAAQIGGFFNIPVDNVRALPLFEKYFSKFKNRKDIVCVSPDHGGVNRTSMLANKLNCPIAIIDKRRPQPNQAEIVAIVGDIKGKDCIIVDDIVDTAGTLCAAAAKLKSLGAKKVYAAITHGVLSGEAIERIDKSAIDKLIITNSITQPEGLKSKKMEILDLAPILSETIRSLEAGKSLAETYTKFAKSLKSN